MDGKFYKGSPRKTITSSGRKSFENQNLPNVPALNDSAEIYKNHLFLVTILPPSF